MGDRIKKPLDSDRITLILNRIVEMEEPYLSKLSEYFDKPIGEIQKYTETIADKGWVTKEKKGRKAVFKVQFEEIWKNYRLLKLDNWEDLKESTKEFLKFSLQYKLKYSFAESSNIDPEDKQNWVKTSKTDSHGESIYATVTATLHDLLKETVDTILIIEATLEELGEDDKRGVNQTFRHERAYIKAYFRMNTEEWNEKDLEEFKEKIKDSPHHYKG